MIQPQYDYLSVWKEASLELERALTFAQGDLDITDIFIGLMEGKYTLWNVDNTGWAVSQIMVYPRKRVFLIVALAGKGILKNLTDDHAFITYIKGAFNVTELEAMCRPSMTRLVSRYGWKPKYQVLKLNIGDSL